MARPASRVWLPDSRIARQSGVQPPHHTDLLLFSTSVLFYQEFVHTKFEEDTGVLIFLPLYIDSFF